MNIHPRHLRSNPLLSHLSWSTLRKLANDAALRDYPKGAVVFSQGEPSAAMYVIVSGRCESRRLGSGRHWTTGTHGPGDALGDREVMHHEPYIATVTVATRSTLLRIPAEKLQEVCEAAPKVAGRVSQSIVRRIVEGRGPGRRIVALHAISERINGRALARRLADTFAETTGARVLIVHLGAAPAAVTLANWAGIEPSLNGVFHFSREVRASGPRCLELEIQAGASAAEESYIAPLLGHLGSHFDFVLIEAGEGMRGPALHECLIQSDLTYVLLQPEHECLDHLKQLMRDLGAREHVSPIVCAESLEVGSRFGEECEKAGFPVHSILRGFPLADSAGGIDRSPLFAVQIRRMAREIGRCRVGLALSSGGARGLAHIGVIQVLEENGIEIDVVAGSSMGAYVGSVWASGNDGAACEKIARDLESRWGLLYLIDPALPPRQGFLRTGRVARRLRRVIGHSNFLEMTRPLRVVATDFETLDRVVFSSGEVARAVEASIAIPGVCVPVWLEGRGFIDGGISDPLPVDVLSEMGVERIIGVNTLPTPAHLAMCRDFAREPRRRGLGAWLNKQLNYFARGNLCDILMRANFGGQMRVAEQAGAMADVLLRPWACDSKWHDFTNPGKYIALGRSVAEEQLSNIKKLTQPNEKSIPSLALAG
jgi:NTE family protein